MFLLKIKSSCQFLTSQRLIKRSLSCKQNALFLLLIIFNFCTFNAYAQNIELAEANLKAQGLTSLFPNENLTKTQASTFSSQVSKFHANTKVPVKVGVLATRGEVNAMEKWQPTMDWLSQQLPSYQFELIPYPLSGLKAAVQENEVSFVITNPGQAVILGRQYPLSWIATLKSPWPQGTNKAVGSSLIVRKSSNYYQIEDLKGLRAVAVSPNAFGGFLILKQEMIHLGYQTNTFFKQVEFIHYPLDRLFTQLAKNKADVVIAPACLLEEMQQEGAIDADEFRVIHQYSFDGYPCAVSTSLYPNWSFAKTQKASEILATQIAQALLAMPEDSSAAKASQSIGWASPISPYVIDKMYQTLKIHPLQMPWWQQGLLWLKDHQSWGWGVFIIFLILNIYHFWVEFKLSQNRKKLQQAHQELSQKTQLLEHAQRVAIVGELGSSIAHEINQPLSAIRNYNQVVQLKVLENQSIDKLAVQSVTDKIDQQISRIDAIIRRLRELINKRPVEKKQLDIVALFVEIKSLIADMLAQQEVLLDYKVSGENQPYLIDEVGMGQVFINLLNNAAESCQEFARQAKKEEIGYIKHIKVHFIFKASGLTIEVLDNGVGLLEDESNLKTAFVTTKSTGLGMGLTICRDILEQHQALLSLYNQAPHGCLVEIDLPQQK